MVNSPYKMRLQGIMGIVFIFLDKMFVVMRRVSKAIGH